MVGVPAYVRNGRLDILSANQLGAALYAPVMQDPTGPPNTARFTFLNPKATEFFKDAQRACRLTATTGIRAQPPQWHAFPGLFHAEAA